MDEAKKRHRRRFERLKHILDVDPKSLAFVSLAEEHVRRGEYQEAVEVAHRGLLLHTDSIAGRLALAAAAAEQNELRVAMAQIKHALLIDRENPRSLALMGRILLKKGLVQHAYRFLALAARIDPDDEVVQKELKRARGAAREKEGKDREKIRSGGESGAFDNPWSVKSKSNDPGWDEDAADAEVTEFAGTLLGLEGVDKRRALGAPVVPREDSVEEITDRAGPFPPRPVHETESTAKTPLAVVEPKMEQRVETKMVDDALWALVGGKYDPPAHRIPQKRGASGRAKAMMVRTSARLGGWARLSAFVMLSATVGLCGYRLGASQLGGDLHSTHQEVLGLALTLEQGSLASLDAAEDHVETLLETSPSFAPMLNGVLAEINARRYQRFGNAPKDLKASRARMDEQQSPSVELLAAMVALSTATHDLQKLDSALVEATERYPKSPKTWELRAEIADKSGKQEDTVNFLYRAYALNRDRRASIYSLARWFAGRGGWITAMHYYDRILELYPEDVDAAMERYIVGQHTSSDPGESRLVSQLLGLVREELPGVAKDEAGRVALVLAVANWAQGRFEAGLTQLNQARYAFVESASFHAWCGGRIVFRPGPMGSSDGAV